VNEGLESHEELLTAGSAAADSAGSVVEAELDEARVEGRTLLCTCCRGLSVDEGEERRDIGGTLFKVCV
jgi:hypothetical protein